MDQTIRPDWGRRLRARCASPIAGALAIGAVAAAVPASSTAATPILPATSAGSPAPLNISVAQLAELEVSGLGDSKQQLLEVIARLPGESGSETELTQYVETAFKDPGTNVGELIESIENALGGSETPASLVETISSEATTPEALAKLLDDIAGTLSGEQLAGLEGMIQSLLASLSPTQVESLEGVLGKTGTLSELADGILSQLTGSGSSASLQALLEILGGLGKTSGTQLAEAVGAPVEAVATEVGRTAKALTESTGVTTTLPTKEVFYLLKGAQEEGLTLGVLPPGTTNVSTGSSSTPPSSTTTTNNYYPATTPAAATSTTASKASSAKVKIVKHKVKGHVLTLVVKVPSAGKLTVTATDLKAAHRNVAKSKNVTFHIRLTRAGTAAVDRKHSRHRKLAVNVKAAFKPKQGVKSSATTRVRFG